MDSIWLDRRALVRGAALALTAGGAALAGCGDPDDEDGGGNYRVEDVESAHEAGTSAGGSSAG